MNHRLTAVASVSLALLCGCSFLKKKALEGDDASASAAADTGAAASAAPGAAEPAAANAASIARYPDEKPNRKDATVSFAVAGVTEAAGSGKTFVFLKKGTTVTQLADRGTSTLIRFKDPKDATRDLMGWVPSAVFGPEPAKKTPPRLGGCKAGEQVVQVMRTDGSGQFEDQCQHVCKADKDCAAGTVCEGGGLGANADTDISFCVKGTPSPAATTNVKCKPGEHLVLHNSTPTCFIPCKADGDCHAPNSKCTGEGMDLEKPNSFQKYCEESEPAPQRTASTTPAGPKPKCVLPSAPPCKSPHAESPKGLCQIPCPTGDCSACDGTCQKGFCVAKQ